MEYESKILENVDSHHLCYMHEANRQSFAMAMIAFSCELFKSAKHVKELERLKAIHINGIHLKSITPSIKEEMSNFLFETLIDWVKIIICFENFMKASLLINGFIIHNIDRKDKHLKIFKNQRWHPLQLEEFRAKYDFSTCINKRVLMLEGISNNTITMSTMLSKKYQEIINLPNNVYHTIKRINTDRNNLHFYHEAKNTYNIEYFNEIEELIYFVDNVMMNLYAHLMNNVQKIKEQKSN